jgi:hypothetical protein
MSRGLVNNMLTMNNLGDGSTLSLDFTTMGGVLDPRLTFSRAGGGTYVGSNGYIYGVDSATSASLAIGTGSKSVTLTATAGVDRRFQVGQTVYFSSDANNMSGLVTAYDASTQVITINATATTGSGSFTSWFVGNASPRFDYSPTTIGEPRGLLIEGQSINLVNYSIGLSQNPWFAVTNVVLTVNLGGTAPNETNNTASRISMAGAIGGSSSLYYNGVATTNQKYTHSVYAKAGTTNWLYLWTETSGSVAYGAYFELTGSGTVGNLVGVGTTANITPCLNGWYRCETTSTQPIGTAFPCMLPSTANLTGRASMVGTTPGNVFVWGDQFEAGFVSSYIPTGASQVTRNPDYLLSASSSGASRSTEFSLDDLAPGTSALNEYTVLWVYGRDPNSKQDYPASLYARTNTNTVRIDMRDFTGTTAQAATQTRTVQTRTIGTASIAKVALAQSTSAYPSSAINGTSATLTSGVIDSALGLQWVQLCNSSAVASKFNPIWARQLKVYPTALTAAQLQTLTTL